MAISALVPLALMLAVGCQTGGQSNTASSGVASARSQSAAAEKPFEPEITPIRPVSGDIRSVNDKARFAVIDFFLSPMPEAGQVLNVYRDDKKVGELRITEPFRGQLATGDIVAGEVAPGDQVRIE